MFLKCGLKRKKREKYSYTRSKMFSLFLNAHKYKIENRYDAYLPTSKQFLKVKQTYLSQNLYLQKKFKYIICFIK